MLTRQDLASYEWPTRTVTLDGLGDLRVRAIPVAHRWYVNLISDPDLPEAERRARSFAAAWVLGALEGDTRSPMIPCDTEEAFLEQIAWVRDNVPAAAQAQVAAEVFSLTAGLTLEEASKSAEG